MRCRKCTGEFPRFCPVGLSRAEGHCVVWCAACPCKREPVVIVPVVQGTNVNFCIYAGEQQSHTDFLYVPLVRVIAPVLSDVLAGRQVCGILFPCLPQLPGYLDFARLSFGVCFQNHCGDFAGGSDNHLGNFLFYFCPCLKIQPSIPLSKNEWLYIVPFGRCNFVF